MKHIRSVKQKHYVIMGFFVYNPMKICTKTSCPRKMNLIGQCSCIAQEKNPALGELSLFSSPSLLLFFSYTSLTRTSFSGQLSFLGPKTDLTAIFKVMHSCIHVNKKQHFPRYSQAKS
jgi:hypothetical protein